MPGQGYEERFQAALGLQVEGRLGEAEAAYRALLGERRTVGVTSNLGILLRAQDRFEEAVPLLREASSGSPQDPAHAFNLANSYRDIHSWGPAEQAYRRALALQPDHAWAKLNLGHMLLSLGRYAEGWPLFERRIGLEGQGNPIPPRRFPMWRGEDLTGKSIMVILEQGFGDQIMYARFAPHLKSLGAAHVSLACLPPLAPLLEGLTDEVVPIGGETAIDIHDYWIYPASLPLRLGLTLETLSGAPYLATPQAYHDKWRGFAKPGFNVGLVWHGNPRQARDRYRSLPDPGLLRPLHDCGANIVDLQAPRGDFADAAAIMDQLDLVVSVDSAPAHLAGALGRPCWVMYPWAGTDWRWMWDRTDSPWYDSVTLYRQETHGDWPGVIARIARDLKAAAAAKSG